MELSDRELWGCAHEVIRQHGKESLRHCARRIAELVKKDDLDGVQAWQGISHRVGMLIDHRTGNPLSRQ